MQPSGEACPSAEESPFLLGRDIMLKARKVDPVKASHQSGPGGFDREGLTTDRFLRLSQQGRDPGRPVIRMYEPDCRAT